MQEQGLNLTNKLNVWRKNWMSISYDITIEVKTSTNIKSEKIFIIKILQCYYLVYYSMFNLLLRCVYDIGKLTIKISYFFK